MTKKCFGCGVKLQTADVDFEGYVSDLSHDLCHRCFRVRNYGEYKPIAKSNEEFMSILHEIDTYNDLVLIVVDLLNVPEDLETIVTSISNDKILVLNKRDLFAKDIYNQKFLDYFDYDFKDKIIVSSEKNYNFDNLLGMIRKYQKTKNVYIVGYTNAGKSTLINKLIYNYSKVKTKITTSVLPSTTLDLIKIDLSDNITLIDTPGILQKGDISNFISLDLMKKITPNSTIKPLAYQVKEKQYFNIEGLIIIETSLNNITFFLSNNINIQRTIKKPNIDNLVKKSFNVSYNDIVVSGLGFIKFTKEEEVTIYSIDGVNIFKRESMI